MKFEVPIIYEESYLPTKRHRIPRIREVESTFPIELKEVKKEEAPVALGVLSYQPCVNEKGEQDVELREKPYYAYDGNLFVEKRDLYGGKDLGPYKAQDFFDELSRIGRYRNIAERRTFENLTKALQDYADSHFIMDGTIYEKKGEPRYVVVTFGLGHNHGGTSLLIENNYNDNIPSTSYFSALERDQAIAHAKDIAQRRGDTESIASIGVLDIKVYLPEMVKIHPQKEHEKGNEFLNNVEMLISGSNSMLESGALVMVAATEELRKPTLAEKIKQAKPTEPSHIHKEIEPEQSR